MDIDTSFSNGGDKEDIYVEQPLGFKTHDRKTHVCKLNMDLYELKRNPWDSTYSYMRIFKIT